MFSKQAVYISPKYIFTLFWLDLLDAVILNPLEMVAEAAANISDIVKVILSFVTGMFKGVEGTWKRIVMFCLKCNRLCVCGVVKAR